MGKGTYKQNRRLGQRHARLLCVVGIVKAHAPHRLNLVLRERRKKVLDRQHAVRHNVVAKDVAGDDVGTRGARNVGDAGGEDRIAGVDVAVGGEETDKTLEGGHFAIDRLSCGIGQVELGILSG